MQSLIKRLCDYKPDLAFSIYCGIVRAGKNADSPSLGVDGTIMWQVHLFEDNMPNMAYDKEGANKTSEIIQNLNEYYYPSFVNCLFPADNPVSELSSEVRSYTLIIEQNVQFSNVSVYVNYVDFFFFPGNLIIYCFKVDYFGFSLNEIVSYNELIRKLRPGDFSFLKDFFRTYDVSGDHHIGNKLKVFSVINHDLQLDENYSIDCLLYDLGTCSPIGTAIGLGANPRLKPSRSYFNNILTTNKISVFESWSALCLYDTFVVLAHKGVNQFNWEVRYFRFLYIHSLFVKSFLSEMNREFYLNSASTNISKAFNNFNREFNIKEISYNFLPQIIYEKIRTGLNIDRELSDIWESIESDDRKKHEESQSREAESDRRTNSALFIVAILTVFTAVWDGAELMEAIILNKRGFIFSLLSLLTLSSIYLAVFFFLRKRK